MNRTHDSPRDADLRTQTHRAESPRTPAWMKSVLRVAGVYNLAWGALMVLFPGTVFSVLGMDPPNYPWIWQCLGMVIGVYGIGYWITGSDPARHWPIVLVGLLGKIFGPIGFVQTAILGQVPWTFGWMILTNDLVWWVPFVLILRHAFVVNEHERRHPDENPRHAIDSGAFEAMLANAKDQSGRSMLDLSRQSPLLVVFLRHMGCTFCREALADLNVNRERIDRTGATISLVHMIDQDKAGPYFGKYGLDDVPRFSDPKKSLYVAFELRRGSISQLFGPRVWIRGFIAGILGGHGVGSLAGDGFQMPGAFLVHQGRIVRAFRHKDAADRPDYCELVGA